MDESNAGPFFIVFEGIDGTGKGTQVKLLKKYLKENYSEIFSIKATCEPSNTPLGNLLRDEMKTKSKSKAETLALLFASDRANHVFREIIPELRKKNCVISERYVYSSFAYQGYYLPLPWLCDINALAIVPDMMIFIDLPTNIARKRIEQRFKDNKKNKLKDKREFFEKEYWFLNQINEMFREMCEGNIKLHTSSYFKRNIDFDETNFVIIDGDDTIENIHDKIIQHVELIIKGEIKRITNIYDYETFYKSKSQTSIMDFIGKKVNGSKIVTESDFKF